MNATNMKMLFAESKNKWQYALWLWVIIIVQIAVILHFTFERNNLFVDEVWTFNMANHYYFPFSFQSVEPYLNKWLPASFWVDSLVVDPDHTFSYGSVFYNQTVDNHPPLYFVVIHTICSFFPGQFSRWFGLIPNLFFFVLVQLTLYTISLKLFKKEAAALVVCLLFGSCWGTVNNVMMLRMYVMLTFFALLSFYEHLCFLEEVRAGIFSKKTQFWIYICSICGFLTHYYYLIYAAYLFFGTVFMLILYQKKSAVTRYFLTLVGALLSCIVINPCIIPQFIGTAGEHGSNTWHNLVQHDFINRVTVMSKLISQDLTGHKARALILLLIFLFIIKVISDIREKSVSCPNNSDTITATWEKERRIFSVSVHFNTIQSGIFLAAFTSVAYFLTASKIVPYFENRYMYIIYPLVVICLFSILNGLLKSIKPEQGLSLLITAVIVLGLNVNFYSRRNIKFLDDLYPKLVATISREYSGVNMITVTNSPNWWPVVGNIFIFREVPNTLMMNEKQLPEIKRVVESLPSNPDEFLVFRGYNCKTKPKEFLKLVSEASGYTKHKKIGYKFGEVYLFSRVNNRLDQP